MGTPPGTNSQFQRNENELQPWSEATTVKLNRGCPVVKAIKPRTKASAPSKVAALSCYV